MDIPENNAICPCCNGTGLVPTTEEQKKFSWWKDKTHLPCQNCGGQTQFGNALGYTNIDPATGLGCHHVCTYRKKGNCWHEYTCEKCGFCYDIDSSG